MDGAAGLSSVVHATNSPWPRLSSRQQHLASRLWSDSAPSVQLCFPTLQRPITTASWSNLVALERAGFPGLPCFSMFFRVSSYFSVFFRVSSYFSVFFRVSCVKPTTLRIGSQSQRVVCLLESESRRSNGNDVVVLVAPQRSAGGKKLLFFPRNRRNATLSRSLTSFLLLWIVGTPSGTGTFGSSEPGCFHRHGYQQSSAGT